MGQDKFKWVYKQKIKDHYQLKPNSTRNLREEIKDHHPHMYKKNISKNVKLKQHDKFTNTCDNYRPIGPPNSNSPVMFSQIYSWNMPIV